MALADKIASAKKISELLNQLIKLGDFRLKYKIMVDPPEANEEWERHDILVDLSGADSTLLLERGGELLRALECVAIESLRLTQDNHDRIAFDCMNFRSLRLEELKMAAEVAAQKVRDTDMPYPFSPMNSRERRVVHLALKNQEDLRTESEGEGPQRHLVVYPKNYKGNAASAPSVRRRR